MDYTKKNGVLVPKQRLFAPMLASFGGGSARGFNPGGELILFTEFTFTNCGSTGTEGPTLATCRSAYSPTEWDDTDTTQFNVTAANGYQDFKIIQSGTYRMRVRGASGGDNTRYSSGYGDGGRGAEIDINLTLTKDSALRIIVGQKGITETGEGSGGGGGGTFVLYGSNMTAFAMTDTYIQNNLIVAAGGGGGGTDDSNQDINQNGVDAVANSLSGTASRDGSNTGGSNGNGGTTGSGVWSGAGGAGIIGNGSRPLNGGGAGGSAPAKYSGGFGGGGHGQYGEYGGFGGGAGGGWGGSGGGGYSGGGGDSSSGSDSDKEGGGGGGSYKDTSFAGYSLNTQGNHSDDHGSVLLQRL